MPSYSDQLLPFATSQPFRTIRSASRPSTSPGRASVGSPSRGGRRAPEPSAVTHAVRPRGRRTSPREHFPELQARPAAVPVSELVGVGAMFVAFLAAALFL